MNKLEKDYFCKKYGIPPERLARNDLRWEELQEIYADWSTKAEGARITLQSLENRFRAANPAPHAIRGRVKDAEHLIEKICRKKIESGRNYTLNSYLSELTDLIGIRALHLLKHDWFPLDRFIRDNWNVHHHIPSPPTAHYREGDPDPFLMDYKRWGLDTRAHPRGYRSIHYIIPVNTMPGGVEWAEVQLRTLFEETWSEIDHTVRYPREISSKSSTEYFFMFNRIAGAADEMGTFVSKHWGQFVGDKSIPRGIPVDGASIARLARALAADTEEVRMTIADGARTDVSRVTQKIEAHALANPDQIPLFFKDYYRNVESGFKQYWVNAGGARRPTAMYSTDNWMKLNAETIELNLNLDKTNESWKATSRNSFGLQMLRYMSGKGVRIWNNPIYCLSGAELGRNPKLTLRLGEYYMYRFNDGLLEDEIALALVVAPEIGRKPDTPLRDSRLPPELINKFDQRSCAVGISAMCAFARNDEQDFVIPIHLRSQEVADGRGLLSVIPKAIHQPSVGEHELEVMAYWTVLREIFEELFGGEEAERNPELRDHDWFIKKSPPMREIVEGHYESSVVTTTLAIDALKGTFHILNLVVVADPGFHQKYWGLTPMWEQEGEFQLLSSRDSKKIESLVTSGRWASDSLATLVEGFLKLKERYPDRVELPSEFESNLIQ